jgi:predicted ATPase
MMRRVRGHLSTAAFVGRAAELDALVGAYSAAAAGRGTVALVGGEAGVGKSRLVVEVAAHARRDGARVLVGQCLDLEEGGLPYAPLVDILRTLDRELSPQDGAATLAPLLALLGRSHGDTRRGDARHGDTRRGDPPPGDRGPGDEPVSRPAAGRVGVRPGCTNCC